MCASIPIQHSTTSQEKHETMKQVTEQIYCSYHSWVLCVDLKMVKFSYNVSLFLCLCDIRAKNQHWNKRDWAARTELTVGENNVRCKPLVPKEKITFSPLHIKLRLIKQFVKVFDKEDQCFLYICQVLPGLSIKKLKAAVFDGPDIRKLMKDKNFTSHMTTLERNTWNSFVDIVANKSIKIHFLHSHLDIFPWNCGDYSNE